MSEKAVEFQEYNVKPNATADRAAKRVILLPNTYFGSGLSSLLLVKWFLLIQELPDSRV